MQSVSAGRKFITVITSDIRSYYPTSVEPEALHFMTLMEYKYFVIQTRDGGETSKQFLHYSSLDQRRDKRSQTEKERRENLIKLNGGGCHAFIFHRGLI